MLLPPQNMLVISGSGCVDHLDVTLLDVQPAQTFVNVDGPLVRVHQLQEPLDASARMFRPLSVLAVGQVQHDPRLHVPLGLPIHDQIVNHDLSSICEISKLCFPDDQ